MAKNAHLNAVRRDPRDEFYTQMKDIEDELVNYQEHFKDKTIFLNCDDPETSNFWKWFEMRFEILNLKRLISTHFERDGSPSYMLELTRDGGGRAAPVKTQLKGNGDFRSDECVALLDEADIVVTNPPFSLFTEYVTLLTEHEKQFIILGDENKITTKEAFSLIHAGKLWEGCSQRTRIFEVPPDYVGAVKNEVDGKYYKQLGNTCWFTNIDHGRRHKPIILYKRYSPEEYPKYDNYDAIHVEKTKLIPKDYDGIMGVPVSWLGKYCPAQFEIIGLIAGNTRGLAGIPSSTGKDGPYINGKLKYGRILIRNKKPKQPKKRKDGK